MKMLQVSDNPMYGMIITYKSVNASDHSINVVISQL
jgi:hypothetical protein